MRYFRNIFIILFSLYLGWILFAGFYFRQFVSYKSLHERNCFPFVNNEITSIDKTTDAEEIIEDALTITANELNFTFSKCHHDPNKLLQAHKANCIGYAIFFSATCNQLFEKNGLSEWHATPMVGTISFIGINIHQYISSPFFKDHDFVKIENTKTGECFFVDPSLYEYTGIEWVRGNRS